MILKITAVFVYFTCVIRPSVNSHHLKLHSLKYMEKYMLGVYLLNFYNT